MAPSYAREDAAFDAADTDGNGWLSYDELLAHLLRSGTDLDVISEIFARFDTDGDGRVSRTEWRAGFRDAFAGCVGGGGDAPSEEGELGTTTSAARAALDEAAAVAVALQVPCGACGTCAHLESWDGMRSFHCAACKSKSAGGGSDAGSATERGDAERAAAAAAEALDAAEGAGGTAAAHLAVRLAWLEGFVRSLPRRGMTTAEVVAEVIKPKTEARRCRYTELPDVGRANVGRVNAFMSHTWGAPFELLLAQARHVLEPDDFLWIDIFAVRQWAGNVADLDFRPVVAAADAFVLCAAHVQSVVELQPKFCMGGRVPTEAYRRCAFFRLWCIVEISAARAAGTPAIMLVGDCGADVDSDSDSEHSGGGGGAFFEPDDLMLDNLHYLVDVREAACAVAADKEREMVNVRREHERGLAEVNAMCRGMIAAASRAMGDRAMLRAAAAGYAAARPPPADLIRDIAGDDAGAALRRAAAAGFWRICLGLIEHADADVAAVDVDGVDGYNTQGTTPLHCAAYGGHLDVVRLLLDRGADVNSQHEGGSTPLSMAANAGLDAVCELLLERGADVNLRVLDGSQFPIHLAALSGSAALVKRLLDAGADPRVATDDGRTPLLNAAMSGDLATVRLLLVGTEEGGGGARGDLETAETNNGYTPLLQAIQLGHADVVEALLTAGADRGACDNDGFAAADLVFDCVNEVGLVEDEGTPEHARILRAVKRLEALFPNDDVPEEEEDDL